MRGVCEKCRLLSWRADAGKRSRVACENGTTAFPSVGRRFESCRAYSPSNQPSPFLGDDRNGLRGRGSAALEPSDGFRRCGSRGRWLRRRRGSRRAGLLGLVHLIDSRRRLMGSREYGAAAATTVATVARREFRLHRPSSFPLACAARTVSTKLFRARSRRCS